MSDRGSPADHAATEPDAPIVDDAPASTPSSDTGPSDGSDAKTSADASSPSEGATKSDAPKPTLADVIRTAAESKDTEGSPPAPAKDGTPEKVEPDADADKKPAPDQDDSKLEFHKHPRWQEVVGQNKAYKEQVESLTPDAEQFRKINSFMTEHHLSPDEVGEGFILMAMAKNGDPRVLQKLDEFRNRVALAIGEALPSDIQTKVDEGELSESAAKELAKARATAASLERRTAQQDADARTAQAAREAETLRSAQEAAVAQWDNDVRKRDPDFAHKENAVARYAKALIQDYGPPPTAKDAVALVEAAYAQVNKDFKAAIPKKAAMQRGPIASSTTGAKPVPKTLREVVEQAANAAG